MNRKQLGILIVAALVLGGIGLSLYRRQAASWQAAPQESKEKLLGNFPVNDVTHIAIKQSPGELNVVKQDIWKVRERYDYPANFTEVSEFIRKFADLRPVQTPRVGASQFARLDLVKPGQGTNGGTLVEFKDKNDKTIKSVLLGKKHLRQQSDDNPAFGGGGGWPDGRYVLVNDVQPPKVCLVADALANAEIKPDQWLNKDFFKVEKLRSVAVTPTNAAHAWKFNRETENGELKLADKKDSEELDSTKTASLGNALAYPSFVDVASPDAKPEITGLDQAVMAQLTTFDHFDYTVKIGKAALDDNYYLTVAVAADIPAERALGKDEKPDDKAKLDKEFKEKTDKLKEKLAQEKELGKWVYLVSKWTIEPLLKDRVNWLAEKKTDAAKTNIVSQAAPALDADSDTDTPPPVEARPKTADPAKPAPPAPPMPPSVPPPADKQ